MSVYKTVHTLTAHFEAYRAFNAAVCEIKVTELFLNNKKPLVNELDRLIGSLQQYRDALDRDDAEQLCTLLREGRIAKEQSEG